MTTGTVQMLYMTMPDLMRSGHRMQCEDFECDPNGIEGDVNYEKHEENVMLLVSQKSYDIIEEAELVVDKGVLLENIFVDIDLNHLKKDSVLEIGDTVFVVTGPCEAYRYLYALAPELPELLHGNRGIFVKPAEQGKIRIGDTVTIIEEAK